MTNFGRDPWQEAMKQAREIIWGPDATFLVACLLYQRNLNNERPNQRKGAKT